MFLVIIGVGDMNISVVVVAVVVVVDFLGVVYVVHVVAIPAIPAISAIIISQLYLLPIFKIIISQRSHNELI